MCPWERPACSVLETTGGALTIIPAGRSLRDEVSCPPSRSEPEIDLIGPDGNGDRILAHCVVSRSRFRVSTFRGCPLLSFSPNLYARRQWLTPKPSRVFAIS